MTDFTLVVVSQIQVILEPFTELFSGQVQISLLNDKFQERFLYYYTG